MGKTEFLSLLAAAALGVAMAVVPYCFPHMKKWVANSLFYGGVAIFVVCLVLLLWSKKESNAAPASTHAQDNASFVVMGGKNNKMNDIKVIGDRGIYAEGGEGNEWSNVNVIDPLVYSKPGEVVCWAMRGGRWATMSVPRNKIPRDADGCMDVRTGQIWSIHELKEVIRDDPNWSYE